ETDPARGRERGPRDVAGERRDVDVAGGLRGRRVLLRARVVELRARRAARLVEVAGDADRAGDLARDPRVLRLGEVLDLGDRERRGAALHLAVGQVRVAELAEGVVADGQQAAGERLVRGDREVPGEVDLRGVHLRLAQRLDERARPGLAQAGGRVQALEVAQHDDVLAARREVLGRVDDHVAARGGDAVEGV